MTDLSNLKIPIHQGINDQVIEPTESEKQNISYINQQFNALVDALQVIIPDLTNRLGQLESIGGDSSSNSGTTQTITITLENSDAYQSIGTSQGGNLVAYSFSDTSLLGFLNLHDDEEGLMLEGAVGSPSDDPQRFVLNQPIAINQFFELALVYENLVAGTEVDLILFFE